MKEDEKKRMLKIAYSKAEMLYRIQHIRVLRTAFNSWVSMTIENQKKCELFQITIRWNALNANWSFWRKRFTHTIQQKAIKMREMELRQNQIMLLKATRFERNKSFCRTLYHWQKLYLLKVTQKRFDNQRQQRARKMGAFLRQLESKYHTAHSPATQIEEHLIPKSETNSKSETIQKSNNLKSSKNTVAKTTKNPPVANVLSNQALKSIINISSNPVKKPLRPSKQDCKFIKEMEERDKVRKERQVKLQEQRLAREKEKERIRAEEEQKKLELEKQEKEIIKKKRQEIEEQAKIILEKRAEERRIMNEKLNLASSKAIFLSLKFKGILPWKTYMLKCQQEKSMADDFHARKQVARVYKLWKCIFDSRLEVLEERAVKFSGERLVNSFFRRWELKKRANDSQYTVAQTINEEGTARVIMRRWKQSMKIKRRIRLKIERDQEIIADNFARKCVPKRVLNAWKFFVNQQKEKRWREYRLSRLRTSAYEYLQQNSQLERQCNLFHIEMNGIE
ncbi:hypothetical protein BC833DRAFT_276662 [Globomyces pollinis-pini]|nr:hypothetical protein BC833DRAFT_276662 [Globomyces pollinis-pini]